MRHLTDFVRRIRVGFAVLVGFIGLASGSVWATEIPSAARGLGGTWKRIANGDGTWDYIHMFPNGGRFRAPAGEAVTVQYLVAGGGGAGGFGGGAGGGGGVLHVTGYDLPAGGIITFAVGAGGDNYSSQSSWLAGGKGGDSSVTVGGVTTTVPGGGGGASFNKAATNGGSGGGGGSGTGASTAAGKATAVAPVMGHDGSTAGGGGGAGAAPTSSVGGAGYLCSIDGVESAYGAGGGGQTGGTISTGALGGSDGYPGRGGKGLTYSDGSHGGAGTIFAGVDGYGSGGGAGKRQSGTVYAGAVGGAGTAIVRYTSSYDAGAESGDDTLKITDCSFKVASQVGYVYGARMRCGVTVVDPNGITLTEGTDYALTFANNTSRGTATVTISGIGDYQESVNRNFTIGDFPHVNIGDFESADGTGVVAGVSASLTGGDIVNLLSNGDVVHSFLASGTLENPLAVPVAVEYLVVGGGGSGGNCNGGGGGGGGVRGGSFVLAAGKSCAVTVGTGGTPGSSHVARGTSGTGSSIAVDSVVIASVSGGGAGGSFGTGTPLTGASGGGGAGVGTYAGAASTAAEGEYGNAGGTSNSVRPGGGGGAGYPGLNPIPNVESTVGDLGGQGGDGVWCAISGTNICYAGGGGGGSYGGVAVPPGGAGGGGIGNGSKSSPAPTACQGVDGLGGGGGGGFQSGGSGYYGGNGGDGVVIFRYTPGQMLMMKLIEKGPGFIRMKGELIYLTGGAQTADLLLAVGPDAEHLGEYRLVGSGVAPGYVFTNTVIGVAAASEVLHSVKIVTAGGENKIERVFVTADATDSTVPLLSDVSIWMSDASTGAVAAKGFVSWGGNSTAPARLVLKYGRTSGRYTYSRVVSEAGVGSLTGASRLLNGTWYCVLVARSETGDSWPSQEFTLVSNRPRKDGLIVTFW